MSFRALAVGLGLALAVLSPPVVHAQDESAPEKEAAGERPAPAPMEVAEKEPDAITGEKVQIELELGYTLNGIVKGARAEVMQGTRYVAAEGRDVPGAGIRVYYAFGLNGFLFVPYHTVKDIAFKGRLTNEEGVQLAREIREERERSARARERAIAEFEAKKRAAREAAEKAEDEEAGEEGGPRAGAGDSPEDEERAKKIRDLLQRFPPEKWKPSRLDEIKRRRVILDIFPNEEEKEFEANYDLWLEGFELWKKETEATTKE